VSQLVGFDQLDQIIGFKIASYSYITTEILMEKKEFPHTFKEILAKMDADLEERKAERKAIDADMKTIKAKQKLFKSS
jgi:hypothetical protein